MNESMYSYMKVGLVCFMAYPSTIKGEGPILEAVRKVVLDEYFNAIEITWIKDAETRLKVRKMLDAGHMTIAYGAQPRLLTTGLNLNNLVEEERIKAVNTIKEGIDEAFEMGAKSLAFLSGQYEEHFRQMSYLALVKSVGEICVYAKQKENMRIVLEVFDYDIDKKSLIGPVSLVRRFAEEITSRHDNFGIMVDLSHIPLLRETIKESILPIKDYIMHAHIGNAVVKAPSFEAYGDAHPRFGFPDSENDVPQLVEFLKVLLDIGFLNTVNPPVVSFEVKLWKDEDPDIVIANAKRTLNEAWAKL